MDKIAAYEMLLNEHPLWVKEASSRFPRFGAYHSDDLSPYASESAISMIPQIAKKHGIDPEKATRAAHIGLAEGMVGGKASKKVFRENLLAGFDRGTTTAAHSRFADDLYRNRRR